MDTDELTIDFVLSGRAATGGGGLSSSSSVSPLADTVGLESCLWGW